MGTAGAKVAVASKLPIKIEMQCSAKRVMQKKHLGQMWREEEYFKSGPMHIIEGIAYPNGQLPPNMPPRPQMVAGYALTHNVSKDLWDAWLAENKDSAMVRNRLIFAYEQIDSVKGKAKEGTDVDSGLGPLVPDTDRRMPKKLIGRQTAALPESSPDYSE